jgi:hypothetical protein
MAGTLTLTTLSDGTNSTSATNCIQGSAKAWVCFNAQGTVAIRASFNVSSITDNGTGDFTINFTNAMPDSNYAVGGCCRPNAGQVGLIYEQPDSPIRTTTQLRIFEVSQNLLFDSAFVSVEIFR